MRQVLRTAALVGAVLVLPASSASAAEGALANNGFEIAFRTGVSFPVGQAASNSKLSDSFGVQFPLWVDLGYRFGNVVVGAYGAWSPGLLGSEVDCGEASCSVSAWRAGLEAQLHLIGRDRAVDPWISLGFGYQWDILHASFSSPFGQASGSVAIHGWDLARVGFGVDFRLTPWLRLGPFVHGTVSQFVEDSVTLEGRTDSQPIEDKAIHSWITIGVKVTFLP